MGLNLNNIVHDVANGLATYETLGLVRDATPGFNLNQQAGGGIPYVSKGTGTTGLPPASGAKTTAKAPNQVLGDTTTYDASGGAASNPYGVYGNASDYQAAQQTLAQIDQGLQGANDSINRLGSQEQTGLGNIGRSYQDAYGRLIGQQQIADRNYGTNRTGQLNDYLSAKSQNGTVARQWLDSARRTLGANGAGGGSAARYGVVNDANTMLQGSNASTTATNNKNITALDLAHTDDQNKFKNSFGDLETQKSQNENDLHSKIANQRATLLNTIASLTGQKTIANGGDYKGAMAAANPYLAQIPGLQNTIDALAATPAIREQAVQVNNPTLEAYKWAQAQAPTAPQQDPTLQDNNVPIINPDDQKKQNALLGLFGVDPSQLQFVQ